jgi:hypothetical protein
MRFDEIAKIIRSKNARHYATRQGANFLPANASSEALGVQRDLTRFDLDYGLPNHLRASAPCAGAILVSSLRCSCFGQEARRQRPRWPALVLA